MPNPNHQTWKDWELKLLGTDTDQAIADKLKRSRESVKKKRERRGIPPHVTNQLDWPEHIVKKLGQVPAHEIAAEMGCSRTTVNKEIKRRGLTGYRR